MPKILIDNSRESIEQASSIGWVVSVEVHPDGNAIIITTNENRMAIPFGLYLDTDSGSVSIRR